MGRKELLNPKKCNQNKKINLIINFKNKVIMRKVMYIMGLSILMLSCGNAGKDSNSAEQQETAIAAPIAPKSEGVKRVLMVGNSHTQYYVSLPELLTSLCKENNQQVEVVSLLEMGESIDKILEANEAKAAELFDKTDADGNYFDYVILQEKTPVALLYLDAYTANCKQIAEMIKKNSPGVAIYVYELMSPFEYQTESDFDEGTKLLHENAISVAKSIENAGVLFIGNEIAEAYNGNEGYNYLVNEKDNLRFGENSLHMLNDAGFLASIYIYKTLFGSSPKIPDSLPLSTGIGDDDGIQMQPVNEAVSNAAALQKIAEN